MGELRIVYYGPGLGGKTTNFVSLRNSVRNGTFESIAGEVDRVLVARFHLPVLSGEPVAVSILTEPG